MGFMAGFGNAFADSMENRRKEEASKRDDLFKLKFQQLLDNKDKIEARDKEVAKNTKLAKSYIQSTGADPKAIGQVFEWVDAGLDAETIKRNLLTGKFKVKESASNDQMKSAGLDPSAPQEATEPTAAAPRNTELLGNNPKNPATKFRLPNIFEDRSVRRDRITNNRLAEVTGQDPEQIQATLNGQGGISAPDASGVEFQAAPPPMSKVEGPQDIIDAQIALDEANRSGDPAQMQMAQDRYNSVKAGAITQSRLKAKENGIMSGQGFRARIVGPDGKQSVETLKETPDGRYAVFKPGGAGEPVYVTEDQMMPLASEEVKALMQIGVDDTAVRDYQDKTAIAQSVIRDFNDSRKLIMSDKRLLAPAVSGAAQVAQRVGVELNAIVDTIKQGNFQEGLGSLNNLEAEYQQILGKGVDDLASKAALLKVKQIKMAYNMAALYGQSGRGASNFDIEKFEQMVAVGSDVDKFTKNMSDNITGAIANLRTQGQNLNQFNNDLNGFEAAFGWRPMEITADIDQLLESDPSVKEGWDILRQAQATTIDNPPPAEGDNTSEDNLPVMNSPEEARQLPPGTRFKTPDGRIKIR